MPGSPPTRSTEPRTKPPPVTRSSSVIPEERRGASWLLPASDSSANWRPLRFDRMETGTAVAPSSSDSVFHSPQASHLPCQREYAAPQFWQTKESEDLAICDSTASVMSARARVCQCRPGESEGVLEHIPVIARSVSDEAIQLSCCGKAGLLRFARNDADGRALSFSRLGFA